MTEATIYHNPRCSKSRQTLQLLEQQLVGIQIIEYLKTPPKPKEIENILQFLGCEPRDIIRSNEEDYKVNELKNEKLTRKQLIKAICDYPKILQRPIVIYRNRAIVGRPPENVLELFK